MTESQEAGQPPPPSPPPPRPRAPWVSAGDLRAAAWLAGALTVAGALLGLVWQAIAPRTHGFVYMPHSVVPDESEAFIGTDGRFTLLTGAVGLLAAVIAWMWRSARGPSVAVALAGGGLAGALLTDVVGNAVGGGANDGPLNAMFTLPVAVHARGLLFVEAMLALLVYGSFALFAKRDDLDRREDLGQGDVHVDGQPVSSAPQ